MGESGPRERTGRACATPTLSTTSPPSRWHAAADHPHAIAWLVAGFTLLRLLLAASVPLLPQEAYYWTWSLHPDWSYFDHPPLATYGIWLTTHVFGQNGFGIKAAAVLWALGWNLLWARIVLDLYGDRRLAFWSLAALNLTLMYEAYAVGPTPDTPLVFAWVAALWCVWRAGAPTPPVGGGTPGGAGELGAARRFLAGESGDGRWWFAAGACIGVSLLGKYSGVLLLAIVFLYLLTSARLRPWLAKPQPWLAALLALALFAPVIWWNAQHDWVSFTFQSSRRVGEMSGFKPRYFLMLVGTQFALLTPYVFVLAIGALVRGARQTVGPAAFDDRDRLLLLSAAVPIAIFTLISFRSIVKINWLLPAWWSIVILGVRHVLALQDGVRRLVRGLASSAAILVAAGAVVAVPNLPIAGDLNTWSGWRDAARHVEAVQSALSREGRSSFVFSPNYKISSLMRFYLPGHPRTYAQDIVGERALQYDYFPRPSDLKGESGVLVVSDQDQGDIDMARVRTFFASVELVDTIEARAFGKVTRRIEIYRCTNYAGHPRGPR